MRLRVEPPRAQPFDYECAARAVVVGRADDADLSVPDGSMSRRHARLYVEGGHWFIEDLGARNGTRLNGQRVSGGTRVHDGDVLRLGDTSITIHDALQRIETGTIFQSVAALTATPIAPASGDAATLQQYAARLKLLNDFQRALAAPITLDELLDRLLERLFDALGPEDGLVLLKQADGSLRRAATRRAAASPGELVVSRRLVEEVVDKGTAALVLDAALDGRFAGAHSILGAGIRSILAAPLVDAGGTLGMVALYSRIHVRQFSEGDLELLVSLASAAALRVRNVALAEDAAERRALERELAVAHDMQMAMLPRSLPDVPGVNLAADLRPARAVGGDLYDFLLRDGDIWFIVADVAGKGVGAALFMAVAKTLFRAMVTSGATLPDVMTGMNRELARDNERQVFVTAFAGRLSGSSDGLEFANAGHNRPLVMDATGTVTMLHADAGGPALGIFDDRPYTADHVTLPPGATLLVYTDGVTDARDIDGASFGEVRLLECVRRHSSAPAQEIVEAVLSSVSGFAAGAPQEDDITLLALRRT